MTFTRAERGAMRRALLLAIYYDEALIDAYRVAWSKKERGRLVLSEDGKKIAVRCRRNIAAFKRLYVKLSTLPADTDNSTLSKEGK